MRSAGIVIFVIASLCLIISPKAFAACPSADFTGDCFVNFEDFAVIGAEWLSVYDWNDVNTLANQWLTTDPCVQDDMAYIPDGEFEMGNSFSEEGHSNELPVHTVMLDSFYMGKYEVTNGQYCDYLNNANSLGQIKIASGVVYASSDISNSYPYCETHNADTQSQIDYNDVSGTFSVRTKGESPRDMSDDPMGKLSWYGAASYCNWRSQQEGYESCYNLSTWECDFNKHGYRLPTEAEWEYAARGGLSGKRFSWGDTIAHSQANYYSIDYHSYDISPTRGFHPIWNDGILPYTSPVGFFDGTMKYKGDYNWPGSDTSYQTTSGPNGFGLFDMTGGIREWCNDWYSSSYYSTSPVYNPTGPTSGTYRIVRGGSWHCEAYDCRVASRPSSFRPFQSWRDHGFRVVLDLN